MDEKKTQKLKEIIEQLHAGVPVEQVKKQFLEHFGTVAAEDLAAAEKTLMEGGMQVEQVQKLCDVHASVFEGNLDEIHQEKQLDTIFGHPMFVFIKENEGLSAFLENQFQMAVKEYEANPTQETQKNLLQAIHDLTKLDRHYLRKENLLFPYLEKAGITAPPKVMWGVDDEIRDLWKQVLAELPQQGKAILPVLHELLEKVKSMITKENSILRPMLLNNLDEQAWLTVARDSADIGYCFNGGIEGASPSDAQTWYRWNVSMSGNEELLQSNRDEVVLPSGKFTLTELTSLLNSLPCDITFVGKDDKVRYFSEGKERVFPRTRTIIGRDVAHCHPPKSLHVVQKLVEDFKAGTKDEETFWIQRGSLFILIRYYAVRDAQGEYLGVAEVTEEISKLRSLTGDKTLSS
ncbi:MAG: DUF438 domain-containing protein [Sphaerochaeta sp.]|nr:DUF438 domain-containing protein [Sphaerochaeta sp.]